MKNSPFIPRIIDLSEELAIRINIEEKSFNALDELAQSVVEKKSKYAVCAEYLAEGLLKKYPQLDISVPLSFHQELSWCVSSQSKKLHEQLNNFLNEFVGSMEYWQLYYQYFPKK
jgi:membrane-bound lytic murein transglycosylase F